MNIGNTYSDDKLYRGIKHYNTLPLLAEDLHEFYDTISSKNSYLLENILGSGIINEFTPVISATGIGINKPVVLNIAGDICLTGTSTNVELTSSSSLNTLGNTTEGTVFLIGWYQPILASTKTYEYGGVINSEIPNTIIYEPLNIQVSSRYQFRWDIAVYEGEIPEGNISINIKNRDSDGLLRAGTTSVTSTSKIGSVYRAEAPLGMDYAVDGLYLIPLIEYTYDTENSTIINANSFLRRRTSSSMFLLQSNTEPVGNFPDGAVWYNPANREFKTYIRGTGFVASASKMGFIQYQYVNIADSEIISPTNITLNIDVPTLQESDIIHVTYEGLELIPTTDYTVDTQNKQITLLGFTRMVGEKLVVTVTRLTEASDVTSLTSTLITHISTAATSSVEGHVQLSDSTNSDSDSSDNIAATPKAVKDSRIMHDETNSKNYKLGVDSGILYIEEI